MMGNDCEVGGFTIVPNAILFDDRLSAVELRVYATLLAFNWKPPGQPRKDVVWPSLGSIAELCGGLHRNTIRAALKRLEALRLIQTELSRGGAGGGATNRYRLLATTYPNSDAHWDVRRGGSDAHSEGSDAHSEGSDAHCSVPETEERNREKKQTATPALSGPASRGDLQPGPATEPLTGSDVLALAEAIAQWQAKQPAYEAVVGADGVARYREVPRTDPPPEPDLQQAQRLVSAGFRADDLELADRLEQPDALAQWLSTHPKERRRLAAAFRACPDVPNCALIDLLGRCDDAQEAVEQWASATGQQPSKADEAALSALVCSHWHAGQLLPLAIEKALAESDGRLSLRFVAAIYQRLCLEDPDSTAEDWQPVGIVRDWFDHTEV